MPSLPWTNRQDASPVEDASLAALLAGNGLPAGADAELRPVADVLSALTARPAGDELAGLAAARAGFHRHVVVQAHARQSPRRRPGGLAYRLGAKVGAAAAVVVMGFGGAAAAAYAGALPSSWQQFAHRAIGAPAHPAGHKTPAGAGAARSAATVPRSGHPAHGTHLSGPLAGHGLPHHAGPPRHAVPPAVPPSVHPGSRWTPLPRITPPIGSPRSLDPGASVSNAASIRGVSWIQGSPPTGVLA
jgi:hypothetical protein